VLGNLGDSAPRPLGQVPPAEFTLADRWIIARCDRMVRDATAGYEKFRLNEAALAAYHFVWSDLADWYLEQIKPRLYGTEPGGEVARAVVCRVFEVALQVLHPVMPFITEALWKRFPERPAAASISVAPWPQPDRRAVDDPAEREFGLVQGLITAVRQIRAEYGVEPGATVPLIMTDLSREGRSAFELEAATIQRLAKVSRISLGETPSGVGASAALSDGSAAFVALGEVLDVSRECARLAAEIERLEKGIQGQRAKLGNTQFVNRAPAEVVGREREKLASWEEQQRVLAEKRRLLGCA